jgi:outer membrane protein OmpA-like peptidoglycan-associated protein
MVMTLGDVLFATGKADLQPGAMNTIDRLAVFLSGYPGKTVVIEGFTDNTGTDSFNQGLSERRAREVLVKPS